MVEKTNNETIKPFDSYLNTNIGNTLTDNNNNFQYTSSIGNKNSKINNTSYVTKSTDDSNIKEKGSNELEKFLYEYSDKKKINETLEFSFKLFEFLLITDNYPLKIDTDFLNLLNDWSQVTCMTFCDHFHAQDSPIIKEASQLYNFCTKQASEIFFYKYEINGGINKYLLISILFFFFSKNTELNLKKILRFYKFEDESFITEEEFDLFLYSMTSAAITFIFCQFKCITEIKHEDRVEIINQVFKRGGVLGNTVDTTSYEKNVEDINLITTIHTQNEVNDQYSNSKEDFEIKFYSDKNDKHLEIDYLINRIKAIPYVWKIILKINLICYKSFKDYN